MAATRRRPARNRRTGLTSAISAIVTAGRPQPMTTPGPRVTAAGRREDDQAMAAAFCVVPARDPGRVACCQRRRTPFQPRTAKP